MDELIHLAWRALLETPGAEVVCQHSTWQPLMWSATGRVRKFRKKSYRVRFTVARTSENFIWTTDGRRFKRSTLQPDPHVEYSAPPPIEPLPLAPGI